MKSLPVLISMFFILGCVEIDESERDMETVRQAIGPEIAQREETQTGPVTFIGFKKDSHELVAVFNPLDSEPVELNLRLVPYCRACDFYTLFEEPPDPWRVPPTTAKCADTAEKWSWVLNKRKWDAEKKHKHMMDEVFHKLAQDHCTADVTWAIRGENVKDILEVSFPSATLYWGWHY